MRDSPAVENVAAGRAQESVALRFNRFDDLVDGNLVNVFSFLNKKELLAVLLMSSRVMHLASLNEIWRPLAISTWSKYFRGELWTKAMLQQDRAQQGTRQQHHQPSSPVLEETAQKFSIDHHQKQSTADQSSSFDDMYVWKREYIENARSLFHSLDTFALSTRRIHINEPIELHWFEARYRWLATRLSQTPAELQLLCYTQTQPHIGSIGFICKVTNLELLEDGRAFICLLPMSYCVIQSLDAQPIPHSPNSPELICGTMKELPVDCQTDQFGNALSELVTVEPPLNGALDIRRAEILHLIDETARQHGNSNMSDLTSIPTFRRLLRSLRELGLEPQETVLGKLEN